MEFSETVVMLTLAALAYIDETPRDDEAVAAQESRILNDLNADTTYGLKQSEATKNWTAIWVGLSSVLGQQSNMAYIARDENTANTYAVVVRGSDFHLFIDALENFDVRDTVAFKYGAGNIAQGADDGLDLLTQATYAPTGATLLETLQQLVTAASGGATTLYITGHSLGGALTTPLAIYLAAQRWASPVVFQVYTFAAPTAGDAAFAQGFELTFAGRAAGINSSLRVLNSYDVVPNAWASLDKVKSFYPPPGPKANLAVRLLIGAVEAYAMGKVYVQPNAEGGDGAQLLNAGYSVYDSQHTSGTFGDFLAQLAFQHGTNTYLKLLGVDQPINYQPDVATVPTPQAVAPASRGG